MVAIVLFTQFPLLPEVTKDSHGENPSSDVSDGNPD